MKTIFSALFATVALAGTVETQMVLTQDPGTLAKTLASPRITTKLDQVAELQIDQSTTQVAIKTKTSVVK